jgi:hypothetical protein
MQEAAETAERFPTRFLRRGFQGHGIVAVGEVVLEAPIIGWSQILNLE